MAFNGEIEIAISQAIMEETLRILSGKFMRSSSDLDDTSNLILSFARMVHPKKTLAVVQDDPSDNRIIECAVESGSKYIVSGDKHLLALVEYEGIRILRVREFLEVVRMR